MTIIITVPVVFLVLVLGHRFAFELFLATELNPDKLEGNSTLELPSLKITASATENGWLEYKFPLGAWPIFRG